MSTLIDDFKMQFRTGDAATRLIMVNVVLFAISMVIPAIAYLAGRPMSLLYYVSLSSGLPELITKPWSPITYMFFHAGIWHLLVNMLMLYFSSRLFTTFFTQKQLLGLYLLGGLFAGGIYILAYLIFPALSSQTAWLVGASASVMAILFAAASYSPMMEVRLLLLGRVKLWHIALAFLLIDLVQLPATNTGGHLSHLGGALFGYLYIRALKSGRDWATPVANLLDVFGPKKKKKTPFKKVYRNPNPVSRPNVVIKDRTQQQIDEILDKISKSGYESLTKDERDFLARGGK